MTNKRKRIPRFRSGMLFAFFTLFFHGLLNAQAGCSGISYSFEEYEPCKFRARFDNTSECFTEIFYGLDSGQFLSWSANAAAGFSGTLVAPNVISITHNQGHMPEGSFVPFIFTLPYDLNTTMQISYLDDCALLGCELTGGIPIESCPDPRNASIIGVKYRECVSLPYSNQPTVPGWHIQLQDSSGTVLAEQVTGADGSYAFYDLPAGIYKIKEEARPDWLPILPASGQYPYVALAASQQLERNFGNCSKCSCDSLGYYVQPISNNGTDCCYRLIVENHDEFCFPSLRIEVAGGLSIGNWSVVAQGWSVTPLSPTAIQINPPGGFVPSGKTIPLTFCVSGNGIQDINIFSFYNTSETTVPCTKSFQFDCTLQATCSNNLIQNGNFEQGMPPGTDESISFAANWSGIWQNGICGSTGDFYNTVFVPPFFKPTPYSQGNFGGMWAKTDDPAPKWREGIMNKIVPITANSGAYKMQAKIACLTPVLPGSWTVLPEIEVWGVPTGSPPLGTCPTATNSAIFPGAVKLGSFLPTADCNNNFQYFNNIQFSAPNIDIDRIFLTRKQPAIGEKGSDVYVAVDDICLTNYSPPCDCHGDSAGISIIVDGITTHMLCSDPATPVIECPKTEPVVISGYLGCRDALGGLCPGVQIQWFLTLPSGAILQGDIAPSTYPWTVTLNASDLAGSGYFSLNFFYTCPGQPEACKCYVKWFQECSPPCQCGSNPFDMAVQYGSLNKVIECGETASVALSPNVNIKFECQDSPCAPESTLDWLLTGPNGYSYSQKNVPSNNFSIPQLQPVNFTLAGTYCLEMKGHCGWDTCPCKVYLCLPPEIPIVHDTSVCRTLNTAMIPLLKCPAPSCNILQVDWYVKPCSEASYLPIPYQISPGPICAPLLILPYKYPNETCLKAYAVIHLDGGCCENTLVTKEITIHLCNPINCSIQNPNAAFCQAGQPLPLTAQVSGVNCNYSVAWFDETGNLVSTAEVFTPPILNFPSGLSDCYKDYVYTLKITGLCGVSTCNTYIRVYNPNADYGDLTIDPAEPLPLCPGEDVILKYTDKCSGPPPKWTWYNSIDGVNYDAIQGAGTKNNVWYSNRLWQTTWYKVEAQNGICPAKQEIIKVEVKSPLSIVSLKAIPNACIEQVVNLSVSFNPSPNPGGGAQGCGYTVQWFKDGDLIHSSHSQTSPVTYSYTQNGSVSGVYDAIITDDCCNQSVDAGPVVLNPSCDPVISGACYICGQGPAVLKGEMILPPQDPCSSNPVCHFQWYKKDAAKTWIILNGETADFLKISSGGHYKWETTCDYGYGPCIKSDSIDVAQCQSIDDGCIKVEVFEPNPNRKIRVELQPNPTSGEVQVFISPGSLHNGRVVISDLEGRTLISAKLPEGAQTYKLQMGELPDGIYFVHLYEGLIAVWTGKVIRAD